MLMDDGSAHCLDILRQQLMCSVDVGVMGQIWYDQEEALPFVDFNTQHKCRNFDEIREWARVRQAPEETPDDYLVTPFAKDVLPSMP